MCDDGLDNDGDGRTDNNVNAALDDPGCFGPTDTDEHSTAVCDDGLDNDADATFDFKVVGGDAGCTSLGDFSERGSIACDNGIDDDTDGRVDFNTNAALTDPGCASAVDPSEKGTLLCDNGVDDDADGRVDFHTSAATTDLGCSGPSDNDEHCVAGVGCAQCDDATDNDGDLMIDLNDPGCADATGNNEAAFPPCSDGVDNDSDGLTDFPADPGCIDGNDRNERGTTACDDGVDNDSDGRTDYNVNAAVSDPGCLGASDTDEHCTAPCTQCDNGIDDDGDTFIDIVDQGCSSLFDTTESSPSSVVISEVSPFARRNGSCNMQDPDNEFIELYNPSLVNQSVGGFRIETWSAGLWTLRATIPAGTVIPPRRFYLLGTDGYATSNCSSASGPGPNAVLAIGLADTAGAARLATATSVVADTVAYGAGTPAEGTPIGWPGPGGTDLFSIERKAKATSTATTMGPGGADATAGNAQDTNSNSADLVIRTVRGPQNSSSAAEP